MARTDRNRLDDVQGGLDLRDHFGPAQTARMLVRVFDGGSIPTAVPMVFLTHPVLVDAADTEGDTPAYASDTAITIPVVVLGPKVPVAGDLLVAHAIGGRWLAGDGGSVPENISCCCTPCRIPNCELGGQLTLRWDGSGGSGSVPITYGDFGGLQVFLTQSDDLPWATHEGTGLAYFGCDSGGDVPFSFLSVGDSFGLGAGCGSIAGAGGSHGLTLADWTCDPYSLHFTVNPVICLFLASLGITDFWIEGDTPDPPTCCPVPFAVLGCDGPDIDADDIPDPQAVIAQVSIWTDSDKETLVASGTTEETLDVITSGTYYFEVSCHGFVTYSATAAFTCWETKTITLEVADGYVCTTSCANPIATVLHGTHSVLGSISYDYDAGGPSGAGWYATVHYSYPGCYCCPSGTVTVTCYLDEHFNYTESWTSN